MFCREKRKEKEGWRVEESEIFNNWDGEKDIEEGGGRKQKERFNNWDVSVVCIPSSSYTGPQNTREQ